MPASNLHVEGLCKRYDTQVAVERFDLTIAKGEFVVLLGPSGSGKTTVLSMLGGFTEPSEGRVLIEGADVTGLPPAKRPTATVLTSFANPHIFPSGAICFGSAWTPGESMALFVTRIWRILVWDPLVLDPGSITNGPAMEWAKQHMTALPLDRTGPMEPPNSAPAPAAPKRSITWR